MEPDRELTPAEALEHTLRTHTALRRASRWRILGWWIITLFIVTLVVGDDLFPRLLDRYETPLLLVTVAALGALTWNARAFRRRHDRIEVILYLTVAVLAVTHRLLLPDDTPVAPSLALALTPLAACAAATTMALRR
ncbi:hypothetical protein LX16_1683 [Stackebrandtia albiflava]|uniref:Uncharacterized protein n=1 Tax=Stackebrandtia albiflava TaxID=406432 RepID=A0A562VDK4_9ACTN|nr:hypothetical protein [Stackebrandtia albiflava]TWJ15963.1 hypothetical protein LX16_1683 [Stackebrandtia albiflava]